MSFLSLARRRLPFALIATLLFSNISIPVQAQSIVLPEPGSKVFFTKPTETNTMVGLKVYPEEPLKFDFIMQLTNDTQSQQDESTKQDAYRLMNYFFTALVTPPEENWVNLSPYEKRGIVTEEFGKTRMGQDLLALDYILKQAMATAMDPKGKEGKEFWSKIYKQAQEMYGNSNIKVNTFHKVWITPELAEVYEDAKTNSVYISKSKLKVMLEKDFLASEKSAFLKRNPVLDNAAAPLNDQTQQLIREIILPALEREINEGAHFAPLRQIYHSMILAKWYKSKLAASGQAAMDRSMLSGLNGQDGAIAGVFEQYVKAYRKGAVRSIQDEYDEKTQQNVPRSYYIGGWVEGDMALTSTFKMPEFKHRLLRVMGGLVAAGRRVSAWIFSPRKHNFLRIAIVSLSLISFTGNTLLDWNVAYAGGNPEDEAPTRKKTQKRSPVKKEKQPEPNPITVPAPVTQPIWLNELKNKIDKVEFPWVPVQMRTPALYDENKMYYSGDETGYYLVDVAYYIDMITDPNSELWSVAWTEERRKLAIRRAWFIFSDFIKPNRKYLLADHETKVAKVKNLQENVADEYSANYNGIAMGKGVYYSFKQYENVDRFMRSGGVKEFSPIQKFVSQDAKNGASHLIENVFRDLAKRVISNDDYSSSRAKRNRALGYNKVGSLNANSSNALASNNAVAEDKEMAGKPTVQGGIEFVNTQVNNVGSEVEKIGFKSEAGKVFTTSSTLVPVIFNIEPAVVLN